MNKQEEQRINCYELIYSQYDRLHYPGTIWAMVEIINVLSLYPNLTFNEIVNAIPSYAKSTLAAAMCDLRRIGLRQFTTQEDDLRIQFSTCSLPITLIRRKLV